MYLDILDSRPIRRMKILLTVRVFILFIICGNLSKIIEYNLYNKKRFKK
jgi:hypothetical protein